MKFYLYRIEKKLANWKKKIVKEMCMCLRGEERKGNESFSLMCSKKCFYFH